MAVIRLHPTRLDGTSVNPVIAVGTYVITPVNRVETTGAVILAAPLPPIEITGLAKNITLPDLQDFKFEFTTDDFRGRSFTDTMFIRTSVGGGAATGTIDLEDWDELPGTAVGGGGTTGTYADLALRVTALEAQVAAGEAGGITGTGPGGKIAVADIYGSGTAGRGILAAETAASARASAGSSDNADTVHISGTETITGAKTIGTVTVTTAANVPTPTQPAHATPKSYVDATVSSGAPDASTSVKGLVRLGGDLGGDATNPVVAKLNGVAATGTPAAGQALVATSATDASWATMTPTITGTSSVPGLDAALAGKMSAGIVGLPKCALLIAPKDPVTGFWPAGWDSAGAPAYAGGSASAGVRPTSDAGVVVLWTGPDPSPAEISSGTGGMLKGKDLRLKHGFTA